MAVRASSDASAIKRSANAPTETAYTVGCWAYLNSVTPARFWGPLGLYAGTDGAPTGNTQFHQISSIASGSASLVLGYDDGAVGQTIALGTARAGFWHFFAMTCNAVAAGGLKAYMRQAHERAFSTAVNSNAARVFTPARFEHGRDGFTGDFIDGALEHCFAFERALDEAELMKLSIALLAERPFPDRRGLNVYYRFRGAHDTQDLSGNARPATFTVGANAPGLRTFVRRKQGVPAAAATGAISGSATWTWGQSGTLLGDGVLAGTSAWVWGQSATLRGAGVLSGTIPWTWSQSGDLKGAGALTATAAWTWNQSGDLKGAGALSGTIPWVWSQTGDLTNSTPVSGAISGTVSWTWGQSGDLKGSGALAGSVAWVWSHSGDLTNSTSGAMSGTAAWLWGQSGDLTNATPSDTPIGGWHGPGLFHHFDEHRRKRQRELEEIEEREHETREIRDELDRQIAEQFRAGELLEAKRAEKERLQRLADIFAARPLDMPPRVIKAIEAAAERRSYALLERMQREILRAYREQEEEAALFAALMLDDE